MQKKERDSIFELFTLEFVRNMVKQIPLDYRLDLAAVSKDFYNVVVEIDEFKYKMQLDSELVSIFHIPMAYFIQILKYPKNSYFSLKTAQGSFDYCIDYEKRKSLR